MSAAASGAVKPLANYPDLKREGGLLFLSGMSARQADGTIAGAARAADGAETYDVAEQLRVILRKVGETLARNGGCFGDIVDVTVFLTDMRHYRAMNDEYNMWFAVDGPARTTVGVNELPHPDMVVELKVVARAPA